MLAIQINLCSAVVAQIVFTDQIIIELFYFVPYRLFTLFETIIVGMMEKQKVVAFMRNDLIQKSKSNDYSVKQTYYTCNLLSPQV